MKDHDLRKSTWKAKINNEPNDEEKLLENLKNFMPKTFQMTLDKSTDSGCKDESPGYIMMNIFIRDKDTPGDDYHKVLDWAEEKYLKKDEETYYIRAFLFQGNNLPPADDNGLSDPFVKIHWNMRTITSDVV